MGPPLANLSFQVLTLVNSKFWFENVAKAIQSRDSSLLIVKVCFSLLMDEGFKLRRIRCQSKAEQAKETIRMIELIYQSSKEERTVTVSS